MKPNALQKLVLKEFPHSKVVDVADATANPARNLGIGVKKAQSLSQLKLHVGGHADGVARADSVSSVVMRVGKPAKTKTPVRRKRRAFQKEAPSGVVTIMPDNTDGTVRRQAKTVIVSRGRVIALQG